MTEPRIAGGVYCTDWNPAGASGPPLLLVHGAGGTLQHWPPELRALPGRRVIALDLPGHGGSPGPGLRAVGDYAKSVLGLLDALGVGAALVAGHSMGGAIALTLALEAPERVAGLVLVGSGARLRVSPLILQATSDPATFEQAAETTAEWAYGPGASPELRREHVESLKANAPGVVHGDFLACDAFDLLPRLGEVRPPTLVICGSEDRLTPPKYSAALRDRIPGARLELVPGAGHMVMREEPAKVAQLVAAFAAAPGAGEERGSSARVRP